MALATALVLSLSAARVARAAPAPEAATASADADRSLDTRLLDGSPARNQQALRVVPDGLRADAITGLPFPVLRATYRTTWLQRPNWSADIGLSALVDDERTGWRAVPQGIRLGTSTISTPRVHLAAAGLLYERVSWAIESDSLLRRRSPSIDLGLSVGYSLTPALNVFGGYRWSDAVEDEPIATGVARTGPTLGVRYRF